MPVSPSGIPPSTAWLVVFLPALAYFLSTVTNQAGFWWTRSASLGELQVTDHISAAYSANACNELNSVFHVLCHAKEEVATGKVPLKYGLYQVATKFVNLVASTWRHDSELGRGYLLISDSTLNGRIWRWEVGGGPIAIGRTLHMEQAGCRSNHYKQCNSTLAVGSGGLAIDFHGSDHASEGSLVVAEWGEGRIVRVEKNGARTPLVLHVPDVCNEEEKGRITRLEEPSQLLYSQQGDLFFLVHFNCNESAIFKLRHAVHVAALDSLKASREAHEWKSIPLENQIATPEVFFATSENSSIGGIALSPSFRSLMASVNMEGKVSLVLLPLSNDDDDEEEDEEEDKGHVEGLSDVLQETFDISAIDPSITYTGALAMSAQGLIFLGDSKGVVVINRTRQTILCKLLTPAPPTSITVGEDGFLYITTSTSLLRIKTHASPVKIPTNEVVRPPKKQKS